MLLQAHDCFLSRSLGSMDHLRFYLSRVWAQTPFICLKKKKKKQKNKYHKSWGRGHLFTMSLKLCINKTALKCLSWGMLGGRFQPQTRIHECCQAALQSTARLPETKNPGLSVSRSWTGAGAEQTCWGKNHIPPTQSSASHVACSFHNILRAHGSSPLPGF